MRAEPNIAAVAPVSHRESDDAYQPVVVRLNKDWRVICCKDDLQWILQRRKGERRGGARFDARSYCRTREALIRVCREHAGEIDPVALAILEALPAIHQAGGAK